jgi:hypothetical protein
MPWLVVSHLSFHFGTKMTASRPKYCMVSLGTLSKHDLKEWFGQDVMLMQG